VLTTSCSEKEKITGGVVINNDYVEGKRTFIDTGDSLCTIDGKPAIRLFSTTWCPHCKWIKETYEKTVKEYVDSGKIVAYHWEVDTNDDTLTSNIETEVPFSEMEIFSKYNPKQSIPTFVFGCRYSRVGNGYESQGNLVAEEAEFRSIIEELISAQNN
tara:strand:- start:850 stop:1323 length:474 start_codon:yes stop_codon:yes gene_type:complete